MNPGTGRVKDYVMNKLNYLPLIALTLGLSACGGGDAELGVGGSGGGIDGAPRMAAVKSIAP